MGSPFKSISCSVRWDNARIVAWTLDSAMQYPEGVILQVENCRAGAPWEVLCRDVVGQCAFVDSRKRNYNKRLNECYRLRLIVSPTEEYLSDIVDAGNHKAYPYSADAENVLKQVEQAIANSGVTGSLLKKRLWGVRCPLCVDFTGQQTVNEHCPRCLGTGIDGGYFPGIRLDMIKDATSMAESASQIGQIQAETVQARCIAYPWISCGDVWVEDGTDNRYVISKYTPVASYRQTHLVYQVTMSKVEYADVLHSPPADNLVARTGEWESDRPALLPEDTRPGRRETDWDAALSRM